MTHKIDIEKKVLSENNQIAQKLRNIFSDKGIFTINVVSSPGSGKTSLLEKTIQNLNSRLKIALVAGDVQTENDADRLIKAGAKMVRPIVTGGSCHLDANMIQKSIESFDLNEINLFVIENVGNLVCPSSYDLGEDMKVVLISTTEGDDKPLKYPSMFRRSKVMVVNKIDLLGMSEFELHKVKENALKINGQLRIFDTSCRTGDGLANWYDWLEEQVNTKKNF
jgi:hydrogenase nickel incorporation protein HypB